MIKKILHIAILIILSIHTHIIHADVYYIFYATVDGKSGHAGIAIDNYKVVVNEGLDQNNNKVVVYDTLSTRTLTYYDMWPEKDDFNAFNVDKDIPAKYFKLPAASWENPITIASLLKKGIPHEEHYPVDGIIQLRTTPKQDALLKDFIDALIDSKRPFNVRNFNCADFVRISFEQVCNCAITAEESIFLKHSTTPNRLYQELSKLDKIRIIKNGSEKAKGNFTLQRLIKKSNKT